MIKFGKNDLKTDLIRIRIQSVAFLIFMLLGMLTSLLLYSQLKKRNIELEQSKNAEISRKKELIGFKDSLASLILEYKRAKTPIDSALFRKIANYVDNAKYIGYDVVLDCRGISAQILKDKITGQLSNFGFSYSEVPGIDNEPYTKTDKVIIYIGTNTPETVVKDIKRAIWTVAQETGFDINESKFITERHSKEYVTVVIDILPGKYTFTSIRPITEADLMGKSDWDLKVMRNEIFARNGYKFNRNPEIIKYFSNIKWYNDIPTYSKVDTVVTKDKLNDIERKNIEIIRNRENGK